MLPHKNTAIPWLMQLSWSCGFLLYICCFYPRMLSKKRILSLREGVSLFKRNSLLQTPWFIGAISCIKPVLLNNRLMKINNFRLFSQKILSIIWWFAINFITLQRKEFLLKRETPFTYHFRPVFHAEKRGFAEGVLWKMR